MRMTKDPFFEAVRIGNYAVVKKVPLFPTTFFFSPFSNLLLPPIIKKPQHSSRCYQVGAPTLPTHKIGTK